MSDLKYNPYSKNLKCKWCGNKIMDHTIDRQCDRCWEILTQLPYACRVPELFKEIKRIIEKHYTKEHDLVMSRNIAECFKANKMKYPF